MLGITALLLQDIIVTAQTNTFRERSVLTAIAAVLWHLPAGYSPGRVIFPDHYLRIGYGGI